MADRERLKLTLWRGGREFQPVEVDADPEDEDDLVGHLVAIARQKDGRGDDLWWVSEYRVEVENLTRAWMPKFFVRGRGC